MAEFNRLLFLQELRGLKLLFGFRIVFAITTVTLTATSAQSRLELILISSLMACIVTYCLIVIFSSLKKEHNVLLHGIIGTLVDLTILLILPIVWYLSVGGEAVSKAYLLKSQILVALQFTLLVLNSLAGKAIYPILLTVGSIFSNLSFLLYSWPSIQAELSPNFLEHVLGAKFSLDFFIITNICLFIAGMLLSYFSYKNNKMLAESIKHESKVKQFARYFSPNIAQELQKLELDFANQPGRKQEIAVMFCDLRNFTGLSESLSPEDVVDMLSEYHQRMVSVVFKHRGTIDKFIGDCIMATFGTPNPAADDAERAVNCALEMQFELTRLNAERKQRGRVALAHGIGIHFGTVIAGNIGSYERIEYTVIGDTVNVAARVEGLCKVLDSSLIITEDVYRGLSSQKASFRDLGMQSLKGKNKEIRIFAMR